LPILRFTIQKVGGVSPKGFHPPPLADRQPKQPTIVQIHCRLTPMRLFGERLSPTVAYLLISYPKTKTTEKFGNHKVGNRSPNDCVGDSRQIFVSTRQSES
jgi:hypothetical protein